MPPHRSLPILAGALLLGSSLIAQESAPTARIVSRIDEGNLVRLAGNTHPAARVQFDRGRVSPDLPMDGLILVLQRSPEQQAAFDRFVESQQDPASPNYHHWLNPEEIGERFGPVESDINAIENWLRSHGLSVDQASQDRMTIRFGGTAARIESTFHTEIHNLDVKGVPHIANMSDPLIPAALAPVVAGPKSLHNFMPRPLHRLGGKVKFNQEKGRWERAAEESGVDGKSAGAFPHPLFTINDPNNGLIEDVTPYDFATIYNVLPLWNKGIKGAGQTIAIAGTSMIDASDLTTFRSSFSLPPVPSFVQKVGNGINPGQCGQTPTAYCSQGDQVENSLDTEWSGAVAPGANLVLVASGQNSSGTIDTVYASAQYILENNLASIMNVSYGLCELAQGTAGNLSYYDLWQTASGAGVSVFVATGDSGSASCDEGGDGGGQNVPYAAEYGLSVSGIASPPFVTAVGGTDFAWCDPVTTTCTASPYWNASDNAATKASALNYVPEIPWNDSCVSKIGIEFMKEANTALYDYGYQTSSINDAEQACSFAADPNVEQDVEYITNGEVYLAPWVDTIGGSGGRSTCTSNNTSSTSTTLDPSSCSGGYPVPSWQSPLAGSAAAGHRSIPDVSFFASNGFLGSAYLICETPGNAACTYSASSEDTAQEIGGTSASTPAMAGVMALINQKAGAPQGSPNQELYKLAGQQNYSSCSSESVKTSSSCYFNDIDEQSNAQPCDHSNNAPNCQDLHSDPVGTLEGFNAGHGYDLATGLGSLNVANVVNAWPVADVPVANLSTAMVNFSGTLKGTSSAAQTVTLKNSGHQTLTLGNANEGITISGADASSFSQTNSCGASVAVGASCIISVKFEPAIAGTLAATLDIADNAARSPQTVSLTGLGTAPAVTPSHSKLIFASTHVGKISPAQSVNLSNTGNAALTISKIGFAGTDAAAFAENNDCGKSLAAGSSCTVNVTFAPTTILGTLTADLAVADNASGSPQKIALSGTAVGPLVRLSRSHLTFPATKVGTASASQSFIVKNEGNAVLGKPGGGGFISVTGADASSFTETNTCGSGLNPRAICTITVIFKPRKTGSLTAAITFTDNAAPPTQSVPLTGTGN